MLMNITKLPYKEVVLIIYDCLLPYNLNESVHYLLE